MRLNFRAKPELTKGVALGGKSRSWPEGGVAVTAENLTGRACGACRRTDTQAHHGT
jgi:hypothetical protein